MLRFLRRAPDRRMAPKMIGNERASALSNFFWVDLKNSPRLHSGGFSDRLEHPFVIPLTKCGKHDTIHALHN